MVVSSLFGGQPEKKGGKPTKEKVATANGGTKPVSSLGATIGKGMEWMRTHTLTGAPADVPAKLDYAKPPKGKKLGPEESVYPGGYKLRRFVDDTGKAPSTPKGPGPKKAKTTSVVASPQKVAAKTATYSNSGRKAMSDRAGSAGYTTSAHSSADPGFTFGSKSSARPNVEAAKKTKVGASHNVRRKPIFRTRPQG